MHQKGDSKTAVIDILKDRFMSNVEILADSLHPNGKDRLTTFKLVLPRCLLAELNTHRQLVRNVGSSRAIPVQKMIKRVLDDTYIPEWTLNKKGMSGDSVEDDELANQAFNVWHEAKLSAVSHANKLVDIGIHKQAVNRLLEPFTKIELILSGTEWDNFFKLRTADNVEPNFRKVALEMLAAYVDSKPQQLELGDWHIPFSSHFPDGISVEEKIKIATARVARVSYLTHDGTYAPEKDYELHDQLISDCHMSPTEHIAKVVDNVSGKELLFYIDKKLHKHLFINNEDLSFTWSRNYAGFYTYRHHLEDNTEIN